MKIGGGEGGAYGGNDFDGRIDEARIYDRALDETEIQSDAATPIQTPNEIGGSITPTEAGVEQAISFDEPGEFARYTVSVAAGESVSVVSSKAALSTGYTLEWLDPEGEPVETWSPGGEDELFFEAVRFKEAGDATLVVDPEGEGTGTVNLTLYDASDRTSSISPTKEGASESFPVGAPGRRELISFDGIRSEQVTITPSEASFEGEFHLNTPEGEWLEGSGGDSTSVHGPMTLPHDGAYTIVLTGDGAQTGSVRLTAASVTPEGIEGGSVAETGSATSKCTDVWIGAATGGLWQEAEAWSAETEPDSSDVACIPTGKTVGIESGKESAGVLQGRGTIWMTGGTLTLSSESHASNIGSLEMEGGIIDGPASLHVVSGLDVSDGTFEGSGQTYLGVDASGSVEGSGLGSGRALRDAGTHVLTVRGELLLEGEAPQLIAKAGAELENPGTILVAGEQARVAVTEKATLENSGSLEVKGTENHLTSEEASMIENSGSLALGGLGVHLALQEGGELVNRGSLLAGGEFPEVLIGEDSSLENETEGSIALEGLGASILGSHAGQIQNRGSIDLWGNEESIGLSSKAYLGNEAELALEGSEGEVQVEGEARLANQGPVGGGGRIDIDDSTAVVRAGEGGRIENAGILQIDSEGEGAGILALSGGAPPVLINSGNFVKATGKGSTSVTVPFDNRGGTVSARAGTLSFEGGGDAGTEGGDWLAESEAEGPKPHIAFADEKFGLGPESRLTGLIKVGSGAEVEAGAIEAGEASITVEDAVLSLSASEGSSSIASLTVEAEGDVWSAGELEVLSAYQGGGEIDLKPSTASTLHLIEQAAGLLTVGDGAELTMGTALIDGSVDLGDGITASLPLYLQESDSSTEVGDGATLEFGKGYLNPGASLSVGEDGDVTYEYLFDDGSKESSEGRAVFGDGTSVSLIAAYLIGYKSLEFGSSTSLSAQEIFLLDNLQMGDDSTLESRGLWLDTGANVSMGSDATIRATERLFDSTTVELGQESTITAPEGYIDEPTQQLSVGDGSDLEFHQLFLEGSTTLEGESDLDADELFFNGDSGPATISGSGEVDTEFLNWSEASFSGSGTVSIGEEGYLDANFHDGESPNPDTLDGWTLVNQGELTLSGGLLEMAGDALLRNLGTFDVNSEEETAQGGQIFVRSPTLFRSLADVVPLLTYEGGPRLVNEGTLEKTEGEGTTTVDADLESHGQIGQKSGNLEIKRPVTKAASEHTGVRCHQKDPVDCATGELVESQTDISIGGLGLGMEVTRSYSSQTAASAAEAGPFGWGWKGPYEDRLLIEEEEGLVTFANSGGETVPFQGVAGAN